MLGYHAALVGHDALCQPVGFAAVAVFTPKSPRLIQGIHHPQIGIRCRILIEHPPAAVGILPPQPGGQMTAEIPGRQMGLRPVQ